MEWKRLNYFCPRCHATVDFGRDPCPACQSVLPATVSPWQTIQAHNGNVGSSPNASALDNAANSNSPAYTPTYPAPEALNQDHRFDPTTQPPATLISSNGNHQEREPLYKFIHHSGPPTDESVRTTRACTSCYNSVKCNPGPNPDCCGPCKDKNRYCRGPIDAPVLIDIQSWFRTALASLQSQCGSLEAIVQERSMYSLSIKVNKTGAIERYDVDLQNFDGHVVTPYDPSGLVRVLDVVFPADQKAGLNTGSLAARHSPDNNVESVVRRFVACSMLLCAPTSSRIDQAQCEHAAAPYVILEFVRQIGHEACNLFRCIFHEADEFANSKPRNKVTFVAHKRSFAFNLGLVHSSVQSLVAAKSNWTGSYFMPENFYDVMPAVLEKLEWLAMGFNKTAFVDGRCCLRSELTELRIGFSSLEGRTSISDSSSNQAHSPGDSLVPNVPRMNSPIAQDSAAQSPGQVSDSSLSQRSGENMVQKCPESPWLAGELERFYQDDLDDVLPSPVQKRSLQEDVIRQAKTELKHHDSAINKHLVKKAALEEKSKPWQLGSAVSSNIVDSDGCAVGRFQTEPAVEKRIRELEEASKRQDLAIQKHHIRKAALERGINLWQRKLDHEPGQPGKKHVFELQGEEPIPIVHGPAKKPAHNDVEINAETTDSSITSVASSLGGDRGCTAIRTRICDVQTGGEDLSEMGGDLSETGGNPSSICQDLSYIGSCFEERRSTRRPNNLLTETPRVSLLSLEDSSITAKTPSHHGWDPAEFMSYGHSPPINSQSLERHESKPSGNRATSGDTFQKPPRQIPFKEIIEQRNKQPDLEYASEGPASSGRSFTHWLLRRRPSSFGSVMNGMFKKFERLAIGVGSARKRRDKRAVPVGDSVKT